MLIVNNLTKRYGEKAALDRVSFYIKEGETVVVMGPSGCGKSTLVRCINRLVEPDSGQVFFRGTEISRLKEEELYGIRKDIGFVFQHFNLIQRLTALENVIFPLVFHGADRKDATFKAKKVMRQVGLSDREQCYPAQLSGGEQQRVGIARALVMEPKIMLWDEPTASLDPILVNEVLKVMEELARQKTTMLVITHELRFACKAADRIILMSKGRIAEEGTPAEIFGSPRSEIGIKYKTLFDENYFFGVPAVEHPYTGLRGN